MTYLRRAQNHLAKILPWPWCWRVNPAGKTVELVGRGRYILGAHRWGMQGGQLWFYNHETHLLENTTKYMVPIDGRDHHKGWCQTIDHPDANFLAEAPELVDGLVQEMQSYPYFHFDDDGCLTTRYKREQLTQALGLWGPYILRKLFDETSTIIVEMENVMHPWRVRVYLAASSTPHIAYLFRGWQARFLRRRLLTSLPAILQQEEA